MLCLRQDLYGEQLLVVTPWAACIVAVLAAALIAFILGIPVSKLKGTLSGHGHPGFWYSHLPGGSGLEYFGEADGISEVPGFHNFACQ